MLTQLSLIAEEAAARSAARRLKRSSATGVILLLAACAQHSNPAPGPSRPVMQVQPPDWFHQQVATARAAKRAHQPKTDTAGAQAAYDNVMHTACTQAAVAGPGKYPTRCDAVLHLPPSRAATGSCDADPDDPAAVTECND